MYKNWIGLLTVIGAAAGCVGPGGPNGFGGTSTAQAPHTADYAQSQYPGQPQFQGYAQQPGQTQQPGQAPNGVAPAGFPAAYGAVGQPAAQQAPQPSFTQRITTALTTNPFAGGQASSVAQAQTNVDAQFKSGPATPQLYISMAKLADHGGNVEQAKSLYQQALGVDPNNLEALLSLARVHDREGQLALAVQTYQRAVGAHPQSSQACNDLALCVARQGDLQSSARLLEQAVSLDPQKALYRNNLAKVLVELNFLDHAVAHQTAVHGPAAGQYNVGVLLMQRGRTDEAKRFVSTAARLDPQLEAATTLLSQLTADGEQQVAQQPATPTPADPVAPPTGGFNAYMAAQNQQAVAPPTNPTVLPTPNPSPQAWGYPAGSTAPQTATQPTVVVPGTVSPTRVGQAPSSLPPVK